ncbi:GNAT family N-acetyltransferase [Bacillus sp. 165]|uniref:GNAT family N-acetyltransferase n=1 Tax=Bacillus sp. 165 TaxID=1529117 RepID=UPI001ADC109D|nr:GNAT family N-acetyltransferase [Bacillus sp. 165]MBO9130762.1 GNAT family N-acetyltransferase [Bacillus sp. 165]
MTEIKRLVDCTLHDALRAWNTGFEEYYFTMTMDVKRFTDRLAFEGLSPEHSIVAFDGETPIGLILNGMRIINGKKVSWNGGTGIAVPYRGKGIGKALMQKALKIYEENGVEICTLEAVRENERAIALYEQMGYRVKDNLQHLVQSGPKEKEWFQKSEKLVIETGIPQAVSTLSFYPTIIPWQTHWFNIQNGESILAKDDGGNIVGYALYKRVLGEDGSVKVIVLYQCVVAPGIEEQSVIQTLLWTVFDQPKLNCQRMAVNLPESNQITFRLLQKAGFTTHVKQVFMVKGDVQ